MQYGSFAAVRNSDFTTYGKELHKKVALMLTKVYIDCKVSDIIIKGIPIREFQPLLKGFRHIRFHLPPNKLQTKKSYRSMSKAHFHFHRGPFDESTRKIPALRFFEAYLDMAQDLARIAASDTFLEWFSPSAAVIDRDGYVWRSPKTILGGMQKILGWAKMRVEHKETKLLSGVVLLRPGIGVVDIADGFSGEKAVEFKNEVAGDIRGDIILCEHVVYFTPKLPDGSQGKEIGVSRMIEFINGPAEVSGQGTYGRQHWKGKVWWDSDVLKSEMKKMGEQNEK